jgi:hypothetical protein
MKWKSDGIAGFWLMGRQNVGGYYVKSRWKRAKTRFMAIFRLGAAWAVV